MSTNVAGVAVCGNCGHELEVVCTGHCAEPDIIPRENYIATMRKPRGRVKKVRLVKPPPPHCTWYRGCTEPVAPREPGKTGRPSTRCVKHLADGRRWTRNHNAKKAAA